MAIVDSTHAAQDEGRALIVSPTAYTRQLRFPEPAEIRLYDTTLRDGEQTPGVAFSPEQKGELAVMASRLGCHILEVGFPASDESDAEALRQVLRLQREGRVRPDLELAALCRAHRDDIERTLRAILSVEGNPADVRLGLFTSGSDLHLRHKLGASLLRRAGRDEADVARVPIEWLREANAKMVHEAIAHARALGFTKINFGAEDSSRSDLVHVLSLARTALEAGATRYVLADTTGSLTPESTALIFSRLREAFPGASLGCHLHNDYDLATTNTIVACQNGATELTVTMNGIGERAGNTPLHALVLALRELYGIEIPQFHYRLLCEASRLVERFTGIAVSPTEPVVGDNIFAHESGIHAQGVLANPLTYEPFPPELVGATRRVLFGKHSGKHAIRHAIESASDRLTARGLELSEELVARVIHYVRQQRLQRAEAGMAEHGVRLAREAFQRLAFNMEDVAQIAERLARPPAKRPQGWDFEAFEA